MSGQLIYNAIRCPDGTVLESFHRHDFKQHKGYFVDGGLAYVRIGFPMNGPLPEYLQKYLSADPEYNSRWLHWGTRGKDGKGPVIYKPVASLSTQHIKAILDTQDHVSNWMRKVFEDELARRADVASVRHK